MKAADLRKKTREELGTLLLDLSREQFNLTIQKGIGQLSKPHQIKLNRRDQARIQTILNEMASA